MQKRNATQQRMHSERVRFIQELRRSNAAQPIANAKRYTRKTKHKSQIFAEL